MNPRIRKLRNTIALIGALAASPALGQITTYYTWTGAANGTNLSTAGNWTTNGVDAATTLPNGNNGLGDGFQDAAMWDGKTTTNLLSIYNTTWPNTGFGSVGVNFVTTANQTNNVQITTTLATSAGVGINHVTNNSPNSAFTMGDTGANNWLVFGRPAGGIHYYVNNSTAPATINPSVKFQAGGGNGYTYRFGGSGNWVVNSFLMPDNNAFSPSPVTVDGPGMVFWYGGKTGGYNPNSALGGVTVNAGTLVIKNAGLFTGTANQPITNLATFVYDAVAQAQTLSGYITGSGLLVVSNGTLTLSGGTSDYTGSTALRGGTLVVSGPENVGVSGPLGLGGTITFQGGTLASSVNNVADYSARFSTAAGQAYSLDTGGQNVTLATGLTSSGGTLAKVGNGTLTLAGANTYSGATTISLGKLVIQGTKTGTGNITVADGAVLDVYATGTQVTPTTLTVGTSGSATLEFNDVNSTTTAPLAPTTVSAGGPITININSGTLTPGQSYPLLAWTSGSAPGVSLGLLNGFIGNLTTNGSSIRLNVTATAYKWTGITDGNWDLTTANNWQQNGGAVIFANGGPALFDDTTTRTNVTIGALVQPTTVTVNSTNPYSMASSGGNNLGGSAKLTKTSSGSLAVSGGANTYTGGTTLSGGILSVGAVANGGVASDLGASGNGAANLVFDSGTLQYTGAGGSSDRSFTLTTSGGTIESAGSGALNLSSGSALGYSGNGPRTLTLGGADVNDNTLAAPLANNGGASALTKVGAGKWVLTGNSTYSGVTTISAGTLQISAPGSGNSGAPGSGSINNNGSLIFERTNSLTISGAVGGTGSLTKNASGTVILANNNTYAGGTTITAGTLQIGNGGGTGSLNGNGTIANDGTLVFNSTAQPPDLLGVISGTGQLIKRGTGTLRTFAANTYTGNTIIEAGNLQICSGAVGANASPLIAVSNNATLTMVRQDNGIFIYAGSIVGQGRLWKDINNVLAGDVTLTGNSTYSGGTFIAGGGIVLGDNLNPGLGAITGNITFTNSTIDNNVARSIIFNRPDDYTFSGNIVSSNTGNAGTRGAVEQRGFGTTTLTGNNVYPDGTTVTAGTLQVGNGGTSGTLGAGNITDNGILAYNRSDSVTVGSLISGSGALEQRGSGVLTLTNHNTYTGANVVSNGTLIINGTNAAFTTTVYGGKLGGTGRLAGAVVLEAGTTLVPGASIGTLTIDNDLSIGGHLAVEVNRAGLASDLVVVSGLLTNTGTGTLTVANLGAKLQIGDTFTVFSQSVQNGAALTVVGGGVTWANNLASGGTISVTGYLPAPPLSYNQSGNNLQISWSGPWKLMAQTNSLAVGISNNWFAYPGGLTSPVTIPINPANATVFFGLAPNP